MTKQEYEDALIQSAHWNMSSGFKEGFITIYINRNVDFFNLSSLLIPMFRSGFIEGYKDGMLVVNKIDNPSETELVDVDTFMTQNVDIPFCESILKYL